MGVTRQPDAIAQALKLALEHHQGGRLEEAKRIYRKALEEQPENPEASHFLGVIALQSGKYAQAAEFIEKLELRQPDSLRKHLNRVHA